MQINKNIAISDTGFIFNPSTGDSFSTNPVGVEIIKLMKAGKNKTDIIKSITDIFTVESSQLEKDLTDFLMMLKSYHLLSENE